MLNSLAGRSKSLRAPGSIRWIVAFVLIMGLSACEERAPGAGLATATERTFVGLGQPHPPLSLPDLAGKQRDISEWQGQVIVVNFWATWCRPCLAEIPDLMKVREKNLHRGFEVLGVAIDRPQAVMAFAKEHAMTYPVLLGEHAALTVQANWGNERGVLPFSAIVDRNGRLAAAHVGKLSAEQLEDTLQPLW